MIRTNALSRVLKAISFLLTCLLFSILSVGAQPSVNVLSPVVNGNALRGMSIINSAESMGAGRITFTFVVPWYEQQTGYLNTPNVGAHVFTGEGAFSYGVNSYVDLFTSIAGYGISKYNMDNNSGLGTIRAGVQGSLPFPKNAFLSMGGQTVIIGGTSRNQINTYRADGYNYFETRTGFDFMGKVMQTVKVGNEEWGFKAHLNEAGVIGFINSRPALFLLGAGLQANLGIVVIGTEMHSRTVFKDMALSTDPLWITPSLTIRTPYHMNFTGGADFSLSANRSDNNQKALDNPRALEPYRVFAAVTFSYNMLEKKRAAELAQKQKLADEKADMEKKAKETELQVESLVKNSVDDSIALENEKKQGIAQMDSMQSIADLNAQANMIAANEMAQKAKEDSLALILAARDLAKEKEMRSDAEKQLLSTGEILLDAVYFETDKTIITINSKSYLNVIAKMLLKYPKLEFEIAGHTDNIGESDYNMNLSQGRADAVRIYLTEKGPDLHLRARGYGMNRSKADNSTKEGRQINRRVELHVTNTDALLEYK